MGGLALITGATGFIGSHIAEELAKAGYELRCTVRPASDPRWIGGLDVERVLTDFTRPDDLAKAVEDVDTVVHAAGVTSARRAEDYRRVNAEGTQRLAEAATGAGVRRFVFVSSLAARGPNAPAEDDRVHPVSPYGESKRQAEEHLRLLGGEMEKVALRPAAVYGPRDTDFLPLFRMARRGLIALPSGSGLLQPAYAADVARAALAAAREPAGFGPYPLAEGTRYTWGEVASGLERALGRRVRAVRLPAAVFKLAGGAAERTAGLLGAVPAFDERRAEDLAVHDWTCDPSITARELGWRAEVPLEDGLERTARWCRKAGWL